VAASGHFEFDVRGEEQVERNAAKLDPDARKGITKEKKRLAKNLAAKLRRAVISGSKTTMGRKVRPTIRQRGETVLAGPHPMLFGTEFGMNKKSGWYARRAVPRHAQPAVLPAPERRLLVEPHHPAQQA
jgi:hypothetical protein